MAHLVKACLCGQSSTRISRISAPMALPRRRWRQDDAMGTGRGAAGPLDVSGAFARGSRAQFMEKYAADLQRLRDREDLPCESRWFDSHCHLDSCY